MVISANTKTNKTDFMVPFIAPECVRISQIIRLKTEVSLLGRERFIKFNLMVSPDSGPTSAARIWRSRKVSGAPHAEHLGKSRYRIVHGLGHPRRFICARRRRGGDGRFRRGQTKRCCNWRGGQW